MKKVFRGIALALVATMLTACGSTKEIELKEKDKKVVLEVGWWGNDPRHTYTIEAIEKFEELHPNIKVNLDYGEFSNYETRWKIKMKAGIEPDIMQINYAWMKNQAKIDNEAFYDIKSISDGVDLSTYSDTSISYGTVGDKLYALPIALNCRTFVYDEQILQENGIKIPESWEDIFAAASILKEKDIRILDFEAATAWFVIESHWEQETGKEFVDSNGKLNISEEDIASMLRFYMKLVDEGVVDDFSGRDSKKYGNGKYAGSVIWITDTAKYQGMLQEGHTFKVGKYPVLSGAKRTGRYVKPATMYAIGKHTKHPKEAAMLLDYLVNSKEVAELQQLEKGVPESTKQRDVLEKANLMTGLAADADAHMHDSEVYLIDPNYENSVIKEGLKTAVDSIIYDNKSIEDAAHKFYETISAKIK